MSAVHLQSLDRHLSCHSQAGTDVRCRIPSFGLLCQRSELRKGLSGSDLGPASEFSNARVDLKGRDNKRLNTEAQSKKILLKRGRATRRNIRKAGLIMTVVSMAFICNCFKRLTSFPAVPNFSIQVPTKIQPSLLQAKILVKSRLSPGFAGLVSTTLPG